MLLKFFRHGAASADSAVTYLLGAAPFDYLAGANDAKGVVRDPPAALVRGNPELTRKLINQLTTKHRYVSGVLSFKELISPQDEQFIIERFEASAFAGLRPGQFDCLWIRHSHNKRTELHFLSPRCELSTGKALNIRPPRKQTEELYDTFRILINHEFLLKEPVASVGQLSPAQVTELEQKLSRLTATRAKYNSERYKAKNAEVVSDIDRDVHENRTRSPDGSVATTRATPIRPREAYRDPLERISRATRAIGAAHIHVEHAGQCFEPSAQAVRDRAAQTLAQLRRRTISDSILDSYGVVQTAPALTGGPDRDLGGPELDRGDFS
jgi:hypothetical protein